MSPSNNVFHEEPLEMEIFFFEFEKEKLIFMFN
jgi:hypothetical protein